MKKTSQLALFLLALTLFVSCSKGAKTLPLIGLTYTYNGFFLDGVRLINIDHKKLMENKDIKLGETLYIAMDKVSGFKKENGQIYPICKVTVTDPDGNEVMGSENIYAGQEINADETEFSVTIKMGSPVVAGKSYTISVAMYDELNPENLINITVKSNVTE